MRGKLTKKQVFQGIAHVTVSAHQYLHKWTKLEGEDNNKRPDNGRKDWKFLHKMTPCLSQSPKVNRAFTLDASPERQESWSASQSANSSTDNGNCSDSSGDDAAAADENVAGKELKPSRQRKRKSNSSAPEILTYTYT